MYLTCDEVNEAETGQTLQMFLPIKANRRFNVMLLCKTGRRSCGNDAAPPQDAATGHDRVTEVNFLLIKLRIFSVTDLDFFLYQESQLNQIRLMFKNQMSGVETCFSKDD